MKNTKHKVIFKGHSHELAGLLEAPELSRKLMCFCSLLYLGKDIIATSRIAQAYIALSNASI